ncbi:hypothetical protein IKG02_01505 [Candidatus Saccharibacteria bacterium]|nr:hypothetical protein [Candidatus Saccharibacteria bacterium]
MSNLRRCCGGIVRFGAGLALILGIIGGVMLSPEVAFAAPGASGSSSDEICSNSEIDADLKAAAGCSNDKDAKGLVKTVVQVLLWVVGAVSVVMIIVSGIQLTASAGNPGAVAKAKNTLIYAIVGLAIAILAYAIVNFVLTKLK